MAEPLPGGLEAHLRDAIRLNQSRRARRRARGGLRADVLSRLLVASERLLVPSARLLDREASAFEVPILVADLADLALAPDPDREIRPPISRSLPARPLPAWGPLRRGDLAEAAARIGARAAWAEARAARAGRHAALEVHVLESAALMARRGAGYARQSGGATRGLSRRLVGGHLALVPFARGLDRLAAPLHRRGIGLFLNDLPPIPRA